MEPIARFGLEFNPFLKNSKEILINTQESREAAFRKPDNFKSIQDEITRLALEKRKTPVIIIDEANYVSNAILNDLKILFNFEMDSKDRAVILLVGLPPA